VNAPEKKRLTAADLWSIPRVGTPALAPDGSFFVVGVTTYASDGDDSKERLWLVPTDTRAPSVTMGPQAAPNPGALARARPLTAPDVSSSSPVVSPDGKRLAFLRKPAGGSAPQLHVMPLDGGEARRLTDLPLGASDPRWLPDGKGLVVTSALYRGALDVEATKKLHEERTKAGDRPHVTEDRVYRFWDRWLTDGDVPHLFLVDAETGTAKDLLPGSERWFDLMDADGEYDISPDGREIAFSANTTPPPYSTLRMGIFTVSIDGGDPVLITPENPSDDKRPRYSPDGRWLVYAKKLDPTNYADRYRLVRGDRKTGEHVTLTEDWDCSPSAWDFADADTLLIEVEERGHTSLYRLSVANGGTPERFARGGALHGAKAAPDGFVYAQHHGVTHPPEIARVALAGGGVEPLTSFTKDALAPFALGQAEEMEFTGAGGEPVHMFVVLPPGHTAGALPLVQMVHGGPYGMHGDIWHWRWNAQVFAAPGYAVAMVNFHGSSGYGERFSNSVLGDWGGKPAEDILLATDALVARGIADPKRLVIAGGSYGGYMAAWIPTRTDRFVCTIVHAPVYNTVTLPAGDITQGLERELGGEPWTLPRDRDSLDRWNPAAHTAHYRTPTLVTHGERDYRCTVQNGLELYGMLKAKGVTARLAHYPDENHWILKRRNSIHWYGEVLGWIARHLA
jgi:dipeptidyl aminopeptidase/acylaminoacyl peptidase